MKLPFFASNISIEMFDEMDGLLMISLGFGDDEEAQELSVVLPMELFHDAMKNYAAMKVGESLDAHKKDKRK
jgi:hypothetical protein